MSSAADWYLKEDELIIVSVYEFLRNKFDPKEDPSGDNRAEKNSRYNSTDNDWQEIHKFYRKAADANARNVILPQITANSIKERWIFLKAEAEDNPLDSAQQR
jgi:hypothetical protein